MADNKTQAEKDAESKVNEAAKAAESAKAAEAAKASTTTGGTSGKSGDRLCTVLCNLPHGLRIEHNGLNFHVNGSNASAAGKGGLSLYRNGLSVSGSWGVTSGINREVMQDWKDNAPKELTKHFEIMSASSTRNDWQDFADEVGDQIPTGADGLTEENTDPSATTIDLNQK